MSLIFDFKDEFKLNVSLLLLGLFIFKAAICLARNFLTSNRALTSGALVEAIGP